MIKGNFRFKYRKPFLSYTNNDNILKIIIGFFSVSYSINNLWFNDVFKLKSIIYMRNYFK